MGSHSRRGQTAVCWGSLDPPPCAKQGLDLMASRQPSSSQVLRKSKESEQAQCWCHRHCWVLP